MKKVCSNCGSEDIRVDGIVIWNPVTQAYEVDSVDENIAFCPHCDGDNKAKSISFPNAIEETWIIKTGMVMENSFTVLASEKNVELSITVGIKWHKDNQEWFGWFEMYDPKTGGEKWYAEGNLEIEGECVVGYDGVFELSSHIVSKLKEWGYDCSEIE